MIKAVVFDLDGTLTNTLGDIATSMNRALRLHGLPEHEELAYTKMIGNGVFKLVERAVGDHPDKLDAVYQTYQAYYSQHAMDTTHPYDGVHEMLLALAERGISLCVFSNKPHADTVNVVAKFFPDVPFWMVRGQMPGFPVKPNPAGALVIAQSVGAEPDEFLYLGDMAVDMQCAQNADMHGVAVTWGFGDRASLEASPAEHIIDTPMQVLDLL